MSIVTIPRSAWMLTDPDTGNTVADLAGIGVKAFVRCPGCGELSSLRKHGVADDAGDAPMRKHPKDTAIRRTGPSAPLRWLLNHGHLPLRPLSNGTLLDGITSVLDYGCGHGADVRSLAERGYAATGWDPYHGIIDTTRGGRWYPLDRAYDYVLSTYVLNVILERAERNRALAIIRQCLKPRGVAFVTVRRDLDGDTDSQRLIRLDFPLIHDGTDFATYRVTATD